MICFGNVPAGSVLPIFFDSYAGSTGASSTISGLAVTDIEIYKGTSMTQRSSDAGYTLLDTDGIDLDGITGINGFSIDLGDNTDAGFYAAGSFYNVVVSAITVDSQTVNFVAATFRIVAAENTAGTPVADTVRVGGTAQTAGDIIGDTNDIQNRLPAALVSGRMDASVGAYQTGLTPLQPTTAGRTLDVTATGAAGIDWANVENPTTAVNLSGTNIDTDQVVASVTGAVGSVGAGGIAAASFAAGAIDAAAVATDAVNEIADGLLDRSNAIETGLTPRNALRVTAAACAGKASGLATTTAIYRNAQADDKNRITATVDADGNRTAVTLDLT